MKELIKAEERKIGQETVQAVSARELYLGLGLRKGDWARWYPDNIENNEFFKENQDWIGFPHNAENLRGGRPTKDFAITLRFAQHIAMMARTEKSHEYRDYLLECEKKLSDTLTKQLTESRRQLHRETARLEYRPMTDALQDERQKMGKKTGWFHYANEADLINRIALGATSAEFKAFHNVGSASVRDYLTELQVKCVTDLQRANTVFLSMGMEFGERKTQLKTLFERNHDQALIEEHFRITA